MWPPGSAKPGLPTTGTINPRGLSHSAAWSLEILSFSLITPGFFLLHHPKGSPSFPGVPCPGPVLQLTHPSKRPPSGMGMELDQASQQERRQPGTCLPLLLEKDTTKPGTCQKRLQEMLLRNKQERFSSALLPLAQGPSPGARI